MTFTISIWGLYSGTKFCSLLYSYFMLDEILFLEWLLLSGVSSLKKEIHINRNRNRNRDLQNSYIYREI